MNFDLMPKFKTSRESNLEEEISRVQNGKTLMPIGVPYFDAALGGIAANDVLLIGAKSGAGKTQLATTIALRNAMSGRRVLYFALEAEQDELVRRIKFNFVAEYFFKFRSQFPKNANLRYLDWYYNKLNFDAALANDYAKAMVDKSCETLTAMYRDSSAYTAEDFRRHFTASGDHFDLFVVDHVHYFDSDEPNDNKALKDTMKIIRDCALISSKPIVLVAHMRKSDQRNKMIVPELEDFHGSSDLAKIATKAIAIAPCYDFKADGTKYPTYLKVLKNRVGSEVERFTALCNFDVAKNFYDKTFKPGKIVGGVWKELESSERPAWMPVPTKNEFGEYV